MIALVVLASLNLVVSSPFYFNEDSEAEWSQYKKTFGKTYSAVEEIKRRAIWERNWFDIKLHNFNEQRGMSSFQMGLNEYSDYTVEEFISRRGNKNFSEESNKNLDVSKSDIHHGALDKWIPEMKGEIPSELDWRKAGWVTPIKNQGTCGSCWAFSAVGALEGQHMRKTGTLVALSEQNLVDCSKNNSGCDGGDPIVAFDYVKQNNGLDTEVSYPYDGKNGACHFNVENVGATCSGFFKVPDGDEAALQQAVATVGPISITIDACHNSFFQYKSGVFDQPDCRTDIPSHAMLIIGYGTEDGKDFWLVKNSFGKSWGIDGYIKMSRNKGNQCGIASRAVFPVM